MMKRTLTVLLAAIVWTGCTQSIESESQNKEEQTVISQVEISGQLFEQEVRFNPASDAEPLEIKSVNVNGVDYTYSEEKDLWESFPIGDNTGFFQRASSSSNCQTNFINSATRTHYIWDPNGSGSSRSFECVSFWSETCTYSIFVDGQWQFYSTIRFFTTSRDGYCIN